MSTVGKAISLLGLFSVDESELGLAELARRSGFDKATTRRLLVALAGHGFIEQDPASRAYRLGAGLTRLARIREARLPLLRTALPFLRDLAVQTSETVHLSEAGDGTLATVHVEHPARANRISLDVGDILPVHATASGIAYLAHAPQATLDAVLARPLEAFTPRTTIDPAIVFAAIGDCRRRGYSVNEQGFEEGVCGVAAAITGADGLAVGTVAIAAPMVRSSKSAIAERGKAAAAAARRISDLLSGSQIGFGALRKPA